MRADVDEVGEQTVDLPRPAALPRCPSCDALLGVGAPWCTLCFADLRPVAVAEPAPAPVPLDDPAAGRPGFDPLTAPAAAFGLPPRMSPEAYAPALSAPEVAAPEVSAPVGAHPGSWPCPRCGGSTPLTADACTACGAGFLAGLRETELPLLTLPVVGDLGALPRGHQLALAAAVVLAVVLLTVLVGLVSG